MSGPRYSIIPADALADPRISDLHLRLLCDFGKASDSNGWLQANQSQVAKRLRRSRETVNRVIRDLTEWGYLRKKQRFSGSDGRQLINEYQVLMDRAERQEAETVIEDHAPPCDPHVTPPCDAQITPPVTSGDHTPCDPQTSHHKYDPLLQRPLSSSPEKERAPTPRGVRLPADFSPDLDWAVAQGLRPETAIVEAAKFRDYWDARAGPGATKRDWPATWRNWVRRALETQPRRQASRPERRENLADYLNRTFPRQEPRHEQNDYAGPTVDASRTDGDRRGAQAAMQFPPAARR